MLNNIKSKINKAFKGHISGNGRKSYIGAGSDEELGVPSEINIAAGSELLDKFEYAWNTTNEAQIANVNKSTQVMKSIDRIQKQIAKRQVNLNDFMACLAGLPAIDTNLKTSLEMFSDIEEQCLSAERKLNELVNLCDMLDMQEKIAREESEAQRKENEALYISSKEAAERLRRLMKEKEDKQLEIQKERHAVFEEAFRSDIQHFKETGVVKKIERNVGNGATVMTFDDIDLDLCCDGSARELEEFLNK